MNSKLKLSGNTITVSFNQRKSVTVKKLQRNGFEMKVQFIDLSGTIVKSFVSSNSEVAMFIQLYASNNNYNIVDL